HRLGGEVSTPASPFPARTSLPPTPDRVCICLSDKHTCPSMLAIASVLIRGAPPTPSDTPPPAGGEPIGQVHGAMLTAFRPLVQQERTATRISTSLKLLLNKDEIMDKSVQMAQTLDVPIDMFVVPLNSAVGARDPALEALAQVRSMAARESSHMIMLSSAFF